MRVKSWLKAQHSENEDHGIWSHHFLGNRWGNMETVSDFIFGVLFTFERGLVITLQARQEKKALTSRGRWHLRGFLELRRPRAKKIKSDTVSTVSPSISQEVMGPDAMILVF